MDRLWKHLMQLDAKALFFGSVALFAVVAAIVAWLFFHHAAPPAMPAAAAIPPPASTSGNLAVLGLVSNQMAAEALVVPVNPFRPGIENMIPQLTAGSTPTNPPHIRLSKKDKGGRLSNGTSGPVIPNLTFCGYFQRPDGTSAALFHDSVDDTSKFFTPGTEIRGATLVSADIRKAKVKKPDGETVDLAIGDAFTLPAVTP